MESRKEYIDKLSKQLKSWDNEIKNLEAKVSRFKSESQTTLKKQIDELQVKKDKLQAKMKELSTTTDSAWTELRSGIEKSWTELSKSMKNAFSKFKQTEDSEKK